MKQNPTKTAERKSRSDLTDRVTEKKLGAPRKRKNADAAPRGKTQDPGYFLDGLGVENYFGRETEFRDTVISLPGTRNMEA